MPAREPLAPAAVPTPGWGQSTSDLVQRNPDIPGLAVLLDDAALETWLGGAALGCPVRVTRHRLRLKAGTSAVLAVRLGWTDDHRPRDVVVSAFAPGATAKLNKTVARARPDALVAVDRHRGLVAVLARADRDLPGLARLGEPGVLADLVGAEPVSLETLSYNPHRRWVGLVETGEGRAVVRCYGRRTARAVWHELGVLRDHGAPVPRRIGRRAGLGIVVLGHVRGGSLETDASPDDLRAAGACLAELHLSDAQLPRGPRAPGAAAVATARTVGELLPAYAEHAGLLSRAVAARLAGPPAAPSVPVHGDCSLDQVVRGRHRTRLIDLDRAHQGEAADDLGGLVADVRHRGGPDRDDVLALLEGYGSTAPLPDAARIAAWAAHHSLAHAADPFRRCARDWAAATGRWLDLAESWLGDDPW